MIDERLKMKLIIKTYLILKGKATCMELTEFINTNFRLVSVTKQAVCGLLNPLNHNDILYGVKRESTYSKELKRNISVYKFKKDG